MSYDPDRHHRRSIRLRGYDYAQAGAYFVTICVQNHELIFGDVIGAEMRLSSFGHLVVECWQAIPDHFHHATLDTFIAMPNHVHGILVIAHSESHPDDGGATHASPLRPYSWSAAEQSTARGPRSGSIGAIIGSFKSASAKRINQARGTAGVPVWQRNYYEHVIRDAEALNRIREYIVTNPLGWALDRENPQRQGEDGFDCWLTSFVAPKP